MPSCLPRVVAWALALGVAAWPAQAEPPPGRPFTGAPPADRSAPNLYGAYCANCHGPSTRGDGPLAPVLGVKVPDLRKGMRLTSAVPGVPFVPQDIVTVLNRGVPDTPMPSYAGLLSPAEMEALARHTARLAGMDDAVASMDLGPAMDLTQDNVIEGAFIYARSGCVLCHGTAGKGPPSAAAPRQGEDGTALRFPDLTRPVSWRSGGSARDVALRVARGIPGTPMPAYRPALRDRELWQLGLYVETLAEVRTPEELARAWASQTTTPEPVSRGAHLLQTMTCTWCHRAESTTPGGSAPPVMAADTGPLGTFMAGSMSQARGTGARTQIASDVQGALKSGRGTDGRRLTLATMPWPHLLDLPQPDVEALAAALASRPRQPVASPPPRHASWVGQMGGKISAVARLSVVEMRLGPLSDPEASGGPRPGLVAATVLAVALGLVLLLGMMALGGPKRARSRRTMIALVPLPVGLALALLMVWPAYDLLPHSLLISTVSADLPTPGEVPGGPAAVRLANRGRDLVAQAPCGLCHTAYNPYRWESRSAPLSGGTRLRSKAFGRVYAGNLTPDKATGLGAWSAVEVRRAIRAGIGRDGRVFHWEAMPYNHFASYTDVELEAMVTYLRSLSPVDRRVPRPEASDDTDGIAVGLYDYAE